LKDLNFGILTEICVIKMNELNLEEKLLKLAGIYCDRLTDQGRQEIDGIAGYHIFATSTDPPVVEEYLAKYNYHKTVTYRQNSKNL
jgi:hypothetical protein